MIPSCADRVEFEGQHERAGRTLTLDHTLDPPWATTKFVLQGTEGSIVVQRPHVVPDVVHLAAGCGLAVAGCGVGLFGLLGAGPGVIVAGGALGAAGAATALTGWRPAADDGDRVLETWCRDQPTTR